MDANWLDTFGISNKLLKKEEKVPVGQWYFRNH